MRFLVFLFGFPSGLAMVVYRERVKRFTGDMGFAEKWFGPGGTYTAILILGLVLSIGSIMYALGTLQSLVTTLLGPFFGVTSSS